MNKLFVCGEGSSDPANWSQWSEWSLVIAATKEQALAISGETIAAEVDMTKPLVLTKKSEPAWGEDL